MDDRVIKRDSSIEIVTAFRDVARPKQGRAYEAKCERKHHRRSVVLRQRQELRRKVARNMAFGFDYGRGDDRIEHGEQQQRIFERLAKSFGLFNQHSCSHRSRLGFRRSVSSEREEWGYERDLEFDLLSA